MDPEPGTDAAARGACRHRSRDLEIGEPSPNAGLVDTENCEILWFDLSHITLVGDRQRTPEEVVNASRVPFAHV